MKLNPRAQTHTHIYCHIVAIYVSFYIFKALKTVPQSPFLKQGLAFTKPSGLYILSQLCKRAAIPTVFKCMCEPMLEQGCINHKIVCTVYKYSGKTGEHTLL